MKKNKKSLILSILGLIASLTTPSLHAAEQNASCMTETKDYDLFGECLWHHEWKIRATTMTTAFQARASSPTYVHWIVAASGPVTIDDNYAATTYVPTVDGFRVYGVEGRTLFDQNYAEVESLGWNVQWPVTYTVNWTVSQEEALNAAEAAFPKSKKAISERIIYPTVIETGSSSTYPINEPTKISELTPAYLLELSESGGTTPHKGVVISATDASVITEFDLGHNGVPSNSMERVPFKPSYTQETTASVYMLDDGTSSFFHLTNLKYNFQITKSGGILDGTNVFRRIDSNQRLGGKVPTFGNKTEWSSLEDPNLYYHDENISGPFFSAAGQLYLSMNGAFQFAEAKLGHRGINNPRFGPPKRVESFLFGNTPYQMSYVQSNDSPSDFLIVGHIDGSMPGMKLPVDPEIVAHEIFHGILIYRAGAFEGKAYGEDGGIMEATADFFAIGVDTAVENGTLLSSNADVYFPYPIAGINWLLGEDSLSTQWRRYFDMPSRDGRSFDTWVDGMNSVNCPKAEATMPDGKCAPHESGGPVRRMLYHMVTGIDENAVFNPHGENIAGVSYETALYLLYKSAPLIPQPMTFGGMRGAMEAVARSGPLGETSDTYKLLQDAWCIVKVGDCADREEPSVTISNLRHEDVPGYPHKRHSFDVEASDNEKITKVEATFEYAPGNELFVYRFPYTLKEKQEFEHSVSEPETFVLHSLDFEDDGIRQYAKGVFTVTAYDAAGNKGMASEEVWIDNSPPEVLSIKVDEDDSGLSKTITWQFSETIAFDTDSPTITNPEGTLEAFLAPIECTTMVLGDKCVVSISDADNRVGPWDIAASGADDSGNRFAHAHRYCDDLDSPVVSDPGWIRTSMYMASGNPKSNWQRPAFIRFEGTIQEADELLSTAPVMQLLNVDTGKRFTAYGTYTGNGYVVDADFESLTHGNYSVRLVATDRCRNSNLGDADWPAVPIDPLDLMNPSMNLVDKKPPEIAILQFDATRTGQFTAEVRTTVRITDDSYVVNFNNGMRVVDFSNHNGLETIYFDSSDSAPSGRIETYVRTVSVPDTAFDIGLESNGFSDYYENDTATFADGSLFGPIRRIPAFQPPVEYVIGGEPNASCGSDESIDTSLRNLNGTNGFDFKYHILPCATLPNALFYSDVDTFFFDLESSGYRGQEVLLSVETPLPRDSFSAVAVVFAQGDYVWSFFHNRWIHMPTECPLATSYHDCDMGERRTVASNFLFFPRGVMPMYNAPSETGPVQVIAVSSNAMYSSPGFPGHLFVPRAKLRILN